MSVHPLIQAARGALTDEDYVECERLLALAVDAAKDLEEDAARLIQAGEAFWPAIYRRSDEAQVAHAVWRAAVKAICEKVP
jgi:molybdopterin-guanine dinucleotide biosynthesis protein A